MKYNIHIIYLFNEDLHACKVQVQRDAALHGDLRNSEFNIISICSRSPPLYQAGWSYSWCQDCQLGSGTSLYCSQGRVKQKSLPISVSKVQQAHFLGGTLMVHGGRNHSKGAISSAIRVNSGR